jgi:NAD(P)-dependent dehydrogenase (short-subunit alcohol dehydrogenase family)
MKSSELFDVSGRATVVTGGASGIGLAYAEVMAATARAWRCSMSIALGSTRQSPN